MVGLFQFYWYHIWVILFLPAFLCATDNSDRISCPENHYYSQDESNCYPCSVCSSDEFMRKLCSPTSDTVCGAFKEFNFFHQNAVKPQKDKIVVPDLSPKKTEVHLTIYSEGHSNVAVTESTESQHWRKVAFALIGALSGLIFLGTLVVLVICRRINLPHPTRAPPGEDDDVDCPYVVIHTIRPDEEEVTYQVPPGPNALNQLARQRHRLYKYHPKRRLLQANEYADDVFESEDSAGSRRRISLQAIPETGQSDNENEMVTPSPETKQAEAQPLLSYTEEHTQTSSGEGKPETSGSSTTVSSNKQCESPSLRLSEDNKPETSGSSTTLSSNNQCESPSLRLSEGSKPESPDSPSNLSSNNQCESPSLRLSEDNKPESPDSPSNLSSNNQCESPSLRLSEDNKPESSGSSTTLSSNIKSSCNNNQCKSSAVIHKNPSDALVETNDLVCDEDKREKSICESAIDHQPPANSCLRQP